MSMMSRTVIVAVALTRRVDALVIMKTASRRRVLMKAPSTRPQQVQGDEKGGRRRGRFSVAKVRSNSRAAGPVRQYRR